MTIASEPRLFLKTPVPLRNHSRIRPAGGNTSEAPNITIGFCENRILFTLYRRRSGAAPGGGRSPLVYSDPNPSSTPERKAAAVAAREANIPAANTRASSTHNDTTGK